MVIDMVIQYLPLNDPLKMESFCGLPLPPMIWSQSGPACAFLFSAHARAAFLALAPAMAGMMKEMMDFQLEKTWVCL